MIFHRRRHISLIITIAITIIIAIAILQACSKQKTKYVLMINNSVVPTDRVYLQNNCFRLPLICVLKEIGINIRWIDNDCAEFQWNDCIFLLSLKESKLIRNYDGFNLLAPSPGSASYVCEADYTEREIIVDDTTLHGVLQLLDIGALFNVDCDNCLFSIVFVN
jgi:hypothetical protein